MPVMMNIGWIRKNGSGPEAEYTFLHQCSECKGIALSVELEAYCGCRSEERKEG